MESIKVVIGETASGKSSFALEKAQKNNGVIINCDFAQCYMPLKIGTAQPSKDDLMAVPHRLYGFIDKPVMQNAYMHAQKIEKEIHRVLSEGKRPYIVGGSTLYAFSLFYKQNKIVEKSNISIDIREQLSLSRTDDLYKRLQQIDISRAEEINKNDRYRILRALEIYYGTGSLPSSYKLAYSPLYSYEIIHILSKDKISREKRIRSRIVHMLESCRFIDEVITLSDEWIRFACSRNIIGYSEVFDYIKGKIDSRKELIEKILINTRQYAKKQRTFYRMFKNKMKKNSVVWQDVYSS